MTDNIQAKGSPSASLLKCMQAFRAIELIFSVSLITFIPFNLFDYKITLSAF